MKHVYFDAVALLFLLGCFPLLRADDPTSRFVPLSPIPTSLPNSTSGNAVQFEIWDQASGGTRWTTEGHTVDTDGNSNITNDTGFSDLLLGRPGGLSPGNYPSGSSRYLDVTQSGASVLATRIPLYASPFTISPGPQGPQGPAGPQGPPGPAGPVASVTAGDASITLGGTASNPTVAVATNGITNANVANGALSPSKINGTAAVTATGNNFTGNQSFNGAVAVSSGADTTLQATSSSPNFFAAGIFGHATAASGVTRGVYGVSDSPSGIGVHGIAAVGGQFETGNGTILMGRGLGFNRFWVLANGDTRTTGSGADGNISVGGSITFANGTSQSSAPFSLGNSDPGNTAIEIPTTVPSATVVSVNLPAQGGTFIAFATVRFDNDTSPGVPRLIDCAFNDGISYRFTLPSPTNEGVGFSTSATQTFHTLITSNGGAIALSCVSDNGGPGSSRVFALARRITAVRIAP